jgi:NAD-dependent dihydropyrimidine dehydrogenase PreA subunit
MGEKTFQGIPRERILWYPTIDYQKCVSCGKCVDFCHTKTFAVKEENGKKKTVVQNLNSCVVLCRGCEDICPAQAISHPSEKETKKTINKLLKEQPKKTKTA